MDIRSMRSITTDIELLNLELEGIKDPQLVLRTLNVSTVEEARQLVIDMDQQVTELFTRIDLLE